jgi:hypothetical protein
VASLRPPLDLELPKPPRWPWVAVAASVVVHGLLLLCTVEGRLPTPPKPPHQIIVLPPLVDSPREVEMPYRVPLTDVGGPAPPRVRRARRLPDRAAERTVPDRAPARVAVDSGPRAAPRVMPELGRIGPDLGDGLLWVRPLPLPPKELAQRLTKSHTELVDSAVTATIQAFLDSVAREPGADRAALPAWTTEVAGKKVGLDGKYLYLAGLKIPAAVLALLPISGGTNQQKAFDRTDDLLAELRTAAARAETLDEFKDAIRELRRRKQQEHDFERNQRTPPPADLRSTPPAPAVPPAAAQRVPPDTSSS